MRESKLPSDVGELHPKLREWLKQHTGVQLRRRTEKTLSMDQYDNTNYVTQLATSYRVRHNLPYRPTSWRVVRINLAANIYEYKNPDRHYLYLRSDTDSVTVTIEIA